MAPFRRQGHVDDHPVALAYPQGLEAVGEAVDQLGQPAIGEDPLLAGLAEPDKRGLVLGGSVQVPVQAVVGDVALGAEEPLEVGEVPLEYLVPRPEPLQFLRHSLPEPLRVRHGAGVGALVVLQGRLPRHVGRRRNCAGFLEQVVNLALLYHDIRLVQSDMVNRSSIAGDAPESCASGRRTHGTRTTASTSTRNSGRTSPATTTVELAGGSVGKVSERTWLNAG